SSTLPFTSGTTVYEIRTDRDLYMVRTYLRDPNNRFKEGAMGSWLMNQNALRGLSQAQVRDVFALPALNDYLTTVKVPAGTVIRIGSAGPISGWGDGGGQQILLVPRLSADNYPIQRTLVDQSLLFSPLVPRGNPGALAAYLDNLPQPEAYSDWSIVNLMLGYLPAGPLTLALNQIGPERYDTLTQLDIQNVVLFTQTLMERRRNQARPSPSNDQKKGATAVQISPGSGNSPSFEMNQDGFSFWGKGVGSFGQQDGSRDHTGFQYQTGGLLAGVDKKISQNLLAGGGIGLTRTGFSWNDNLGDGNMTQINLGLYGSVLAPPFFVDGTLTGGIRKANVSRRISFPTVDRLATSFPDGYNLAAGIDGGLNKRINDWNVQPLARMSLIYIAQDALSESAADSLSLKVDRVNSWTWRGELGVRVSRNISFQNGFRVIPELWLGFGYLAPLDNRELKASLNNQPGSFTVNGYNNTSSSLLTRLGLITQGWGRTSLFLRYEGDYRSDFMGHILNAGIQVPF
ncbi:MAG: hypothetical protein C0407_13555, partial [Desulfobacca sp.]|nr:hypothetical protein [Desulfobacca sp.]